LHPSQSLVLELGLGATACRVVGLFEPQT
jgi:hypothetical protein